MHKSILVISLILAVADQAWSAPAAGGTSEIETLFSDYLKALASLIKTVQILRLGGVAPNPAAGTTEGGIAPSPGVALGPSQSADGNIIPPQSVNTAAANPKPFQSSGLGNVQSKSTAGTAGKMVQEKIRPVQFLAVNVKSSLLDDSKIGKPAKEITAPPFKGNEVSN